MKHICLRKQCVQHKELFPLTFPSFFKMERKMYPRFGGKGLVQNSCVRVCFRRFNYSDFRRKSEFKNGTILSCFLGVKLVVSRATRSSSGACIIFVKHITLHLLLSRKKLLSTEDLSLRTSSKMCLKR